MTRRDFLQTAGLAAGVTPTLRAAEHPAEIDLNVCTVVITENASARERNAARVLVEEAQKRCQLRWAMRSTGETVSGTIVYLATQASASRLPSRVTKLVVTTTDGFAVMSGHDGNGHWLAVVGADERGLLFGVGKLLRTVTFGKQSATVDARLVAGIEAPKYLLRGHQLGYRPKTNAYDAWDVATWDQYIRDLAMFATNAIELIPPRSDDAPDSPHFPLPPEQMMVEMSRICDEYGLDVWIWYPAMDPDYADEATVESALKEWAHVFQRLPRIDAVFVPGGDPGHTEPQAMLAFLEKQKANLRRYHPRAQMWMSAQGFTQSWSDEFLALSENSHVATWLDGVVFGPQSRLSLPELRKRLPPRYPIRFYPDLTHSVECQFPVPDWDIAHALTEGREVVNPRPQDQANILRRYSPDTVGFITYSEGCNDDVNKFVWSALGWNPDKHVTDALREFAHYFFGQPFEDGMAQGLLHLEENWRGPLATNGAVSVTLARFRDMEQSASPALLENWRFQQALYRAYYDAFVQSRLVGESAALQQSLDLLGRVEQIGWASQPLDVGAPSSSSPPNGLEPAILLDEAERILEQVMLNPAGVRLRTRVRELGEALLQSIRMQLAVDRYRGEAVNRAGNLETLETPVTDVAWLRAQVQSIKRLGSANEQVAAIRRLITRTDPGPGGFYDEVGNPRNRPHVLLGLGSEQDPEFRASVLTGFSYPDRFGSTTPIAWKRWGETLFDAPLRVEYKDLDRDAQYRLKVVYSSESRRSKIRLVANGTHEIHALLERPLPQKPLEFDIPYEATAAGELTLAWTREQGLGGNGRGAQVCEIWLMKR